MITLVRGVHIQVLVPPSQVVVVNVPRVLCAELTAYLLGQQGPGLGAAKPPGSGLPGKWVGGQVNGEPIEEKMHINVISILDGKPPVIEPPVLALLEEVCLAVVPLQGPVDVTGQAPLRDALGVLVTPHMRLSKNIFVPTNCFCEVILLPGRIKLPELV